MSVGGQEIAVVETIVPQDRHPSRVSHRVAEDRPIVDEGVELATIRVSLVYGRDVHP